MGFNKNAPDSVKEAFIKHLIRTSEGVNVATPTEKKEILASGDKVKMIRMFDEEKRSDEQMAFNFMDEISVNPRKKKAKIAL